MIIDEIGAQAVAHDSGGVVASVARESFIYARAGRTVELPVEALDVYYFRLPDALRWDDGTPLRDDEAQQLLADVADTFAHWGQRCEFVFPGDPRILPDLDSLVGWITANAR